MKARFNCRLYPHPGQAHSLARAFGCARVVWNDALAYCQQTREQRGKTPSGYDLKKIVVTQGKQDPRRAWLAEVSSVVLNESVLDLGVAFKTFFASI
ncbi:MAG: helix-turn-helix domain-containing protein, partial [Cyanophyceae cyanobacterium]